MRKQTHISIFGIVQGVFFRVSAASVARKMQLSGYARNLPNSSVEVLAEGEEEKLKRMIEWCKQGPPGAHVDHIEVEWCEATNRFQSFQIR